MYKNQIAYSRHHAYNSLVSVHQRSVVGVMTRGHDTYLAGFDELQKEERGRERDREPEQSEAAAVQGRTARTETSTGIQLNSTVVASSKNTRPSAVTCVLRGHTSVNGTRKRRRRPGKSLFTTKTSRTRNDKRRVRPGVLRGCARKLSLPVT